MHRDENGNNTRNGGTPHHHGGEYIYIVKNTDIIMAKKVLIISSSPRRGGNSDTLCDQFMQGAADAGHAVRKIFLRDKHVNYCVGCGVCTTGKPCSQKDDAAEIIEAMLDADVIVMATPVYFYSVSAQLKTLIDRCCARYTEMSDKEFYLIMTAAERDVESMQPTVAVLRGFLNCLDNPVERGIIYGLGVWQPGEVKSTPAMREAYEAGAAV